MTRGARIDGSAVVSPDARLAEGFEAGPFALVEEGVCAGRDCRLAAGAILRRGAVLAGKVFVDSHAVIGGDPQSLSFDPQTESGVSVGEGTRIREGVTVNRASEAGALTRVGAGCYLMAGSHVGHDCVLGDGVVVCNATLLAGHVEVGNHAFLGGGAAVHQFCRIGERAMVGGMTIVSVDVPPFVTVAGRNTVHGLNLLGLKRGGFSREEIADLKRCYRAVFLRGGDPGKRAREAAADGECGGSPAGRRFLDFFSATGRGFVRSGGGRRE